MERSRRMLLDSSGELTQSADDDCFLDAPLLPSQKLQADIRPIFHPVPTVTVNFILLLVQVAFVALTAVSGYFCLFDNVEECKKYIDPFNLSTIVIISKVILWLLHVVHERFLHCHLRNARNRGYLKLYRSTSDLKGLPLLINSLGNASVLVIISLWDSFGDRNLYLYLILSVLILELILTVIFLLMYTVRIYKFNRSKPEADIVEENKIHAFQKRTVPGIGFRDGSSLEEIIEKQGDTIEYLKRNNALLSQQLLTVVSPHSDEQVGIQ